MAGVGGVAAVGGTGTVVGTQIANKCHNESSLKRAQEAIDDYISYRNKIVELWQKIENMCHAISIKVKIFGAESILQYLWYIYLNFNPFTVDHKVIAKSLSAISKIIKIPVCLGLIAVVVVGTGGFFFNLYELVLSAIVIHKKQPHPAAVEIRTKAIVELNIEMEKLQTIRDSLERNV